ncbi:MAG: hypothetical protein LBQ83_07890 [Candidatus Margulisbacteria bacterium]|jgi:hypothetical protein|nr:hypothetical protein [Candidatus Margulisiibacteriota bacterium]
MRNLQIIGRKLSYRGCVVALGLIFILSGCGREDTVPEPVPAQNIPTANITRNLPEAIAAVAQEQASPAAAPLTEPPPEATAAVAQEQASPAAALLAAAADQDSALIMGPPGKTAFNPELPLTRIEMFGIFVSLLERQGVPLPAIDLPQFSDIDLTRAVEMAKATQYGLLRGYPDGSTRLEQPTRKAEVACVFARYITLSGENSLLGDTQDFGDVPDTHWAHQAIAQTGMYFAEQTGENAGQFQPQGLLSRRDTARLLAQFRYVQAQRQELPPLENPLSAVSALESSAVASAP